MAGLRQPVPRATIAGMLAAAARQRPRLQAAARERARLRPLIRAARGAERVRLMALYDATVSADWMPGLPGGLKSACSARRSSGPIGSASGGSAPARRLPRTKAWREKLRQKYDDFEAARLRDEELAADEDMGE